MCWLVTELQIKFILNIFKLKNWISFAIDISTNISNNGFGICSVIYYEILRVFDK
jgi:hypothetical protein